MTIRVTDTYAMTYYWDQDAFEDMIYNWHKEWGRQSTRHGSV